MKIPSNPHLQLLHLCMYGHSKWSGRLGFAQPLFCRQTLHICTSNLMQMELLYSSTLMHVELYIYTNYGSLMLRLLFSSRRLKICSGTTLVVFKKLPIIVQTSLTIGNIASGISMAIPSLQLKPVLPVAQTVTTCNKCLQVVKISA